MPRSNGEGVKFLAPYFTKLNPSSVVDVGPGAGTYSDAFRKADAHWTAIEIWQPYLDTYNLASKYDTVICADVRSIELPDAELCIAGDVLEHMGKPDALAVIDKMRAACDWLMVSVPIIHYEQGALEGNPFETHRYHWTTDEMSSCLGAEPVTPPVWQCAAWCIEADRS